MGNRIDIKNLKVAEFLSEETVAFSASLYWDGKKVGEASNDGHGGANRILLLENGKMDWSLMDEMAKEAETHTWTYEGLTEPHSLDSYISQLVEDKQEEKFLKKECRKNTLLRIPDRTYKDGEYDCIKVPYTPMVKDQVIKRYGKDVLILNESIN